jgi:hypothetical protein
LCRTQRSSMTSAGGTSTGSRRSLATAAGHWRSLRVSISSGCTTAYSMFASSLFAKTVFVKTVLARTVLVKTVLARIVLARTVLARTVLARTVLARTREG